MKKIYLWHDQILLGPLSRTSSGSNYIVTLALFFLFLKCFLELRWFYIHDNVLTNTFFIFTLIMIIVTMENPKESITNISIKAKTHYKARTGHREAMACGPLSVALL